MQQDQQQHKLPYDADAERSVLGGILLAGRQSADTAECMAMLDERAFHVRPHAQVWSAIVELYRADGAIDEVTVSARCAGHLALIAGLTEACASTANLVHYARIVRDAWLARQLIEASEAAARACRNGTPIADVLSAHARKVADISERGTRANVQDFVQVMGEVAKDARLVTLGKGRPAGIRTGLCDLDDVLGGFKPGQLIVLAARPGVGKTALLVRFLLAAGMVADRRALVFSLEMTAKDIGARAVSVIGRVDLHRLVGGSVTIADAEACDAAVRQSQGNLRIHIDDTPGVTLDHVRAVARQCQARQPLSVIAVDYLQLMGTPRGDSRERAVAELSGGLKHIAKEFGVPVIALSQLNRSVEARADKRPMMSDLRESGALEQDADVVLLLWQKANDGSVVKCTIGKHRNGPTGEIDLAWIADCARFENATRFTRSK